MLQMSGRVLDPRRDRRRMYAERRRRADRELELKLRSHIQFSDEVAAEEIAGGATPPEDGYL